MEKETINNIEFIRDAGLIIGESLKSVLEGFKDSIRKVLPRKKEALKYCRHSKKRQRLIKYITFAEEVLKTESSKKA